MWKCKSQEGKSQPTKAHVIEPIVEDIKVDIEMQESENKGTNRSVDQQVQKAKEEEMNIKDWICLAQRMVI